MLQQGRFFSNHVRKFGNNPCAGDSIFQVQRKRYAMQLECFFQARECIPTSLAECASSAAANLSTFNVFPDLRELESQLVAPSTQCAREGSYR